MTLSPLAMSLSPLAMSLDSRGPNLSYISKNPRPPLFGFLAGQGSNILAGFR